MRRAGGVIAAYLIVLQAVLAGLAVGAAPVAADTLAVFCQSGSVSNQTPDPENNRHVTPDCCVAGCALHAAGLPGPAVIAAPRPQ